MAETTIQWANYTFNPWRGCTKISPGCTNCYADTLSKRNPKVLGIWGDKGTRVIASEDYWRQPLKWDQAAKDAGERHRVFCASLADVFEDRPELFMPRARMWDLVYHTPNLDWLILTKRPENIVRLMPSAVYQKGNETVSPPFFNVWLGVSVEDQQRADERIPILLATPAAVRFLSVEPLLGPVDLTRETFPDGSGWRNPLTGQFHGLECTGVDGHPDFIAETCEPSLPKIDWCIIGGESGPNSRPCDMAWIRSIRDQCKAAGVACFIKQLGSYPVHEEDLGDDWPIGSIMDSDSLHNWRPLLKDRKGGDLDEWPEHLRVREFPNETKILTDEQIDDYRHCDDAEEF